MTNLKRNRRKDKHRHNYQARMLKFGTYAMGCRQHPGVVVETEIYPSDIWGSSIGIKSLVDGVVESCSLMHCSPDPIPKELAEKYAAYFKKHGQKMFSFVYNSKGYDQWVDDWHEGKGEPGQSLREYLHMTEEEYQIFATASWPKLEEV